MGEIYTKDGITIEAIPDTDTIRDCDECFFHEEENKLRCNCELIRKWEVPDCVDDRENSQSVIYVEVKG